MQGKVEWWFLIFLEYLLVNKSGRGGKAQPLRLIKKQRNWDAVVKEDLQNKAICLGFPGGEGEIHQRSATRSLFQRTDSSK